MSLNLDRSNWKRVRLGDVVLRCRIQVDPVDSGVDRYVAGGHVDTESVIIQRSGEVADGQMGSTFRYLFKPGQVLFVSARPYLRKVGVPDFAGVVADKTYVLDAAPGNGLLHDLLPFLLTSDRFVEYATQEATGSMNPRLLWGAMQRYEFHLPPLDEQKRISGLLWAVEHELRSVALAAAAANRVRSMTRSELFESASAPAVRFDSICNIPSQNGVTLQKSERAGDMPMVNMGEMFRGEVISQASEYERVLAPGQNFLLERGDLLFARRSIVFEGAGACCLVPELNEPYTFESSIIRSRVIAGVADSRYVLHFFRSDRGRDVMSKIVRRGPVSGIAGSDLRTLELPLPSLASQHHIVETIERAGSAGADLSGRAEAASVLRRVLLIDIFGDN